MIKVWTIENAADKNQYTPTPAALNATTPHITQVTANWINLVFLACLFPALDTALAFLFLRLASICGIILDRNCIGITINKKNMYNHPPLVKLPKISVIGVAPKFHKLNNVVAFIGRQIVTTR
jgi:hypothetical protein